MNESTTAERLDTHLIELTRLLELWRYRFVFNAPYKPEELLLKIFMQLDLIQSLREQLRQEQTCHL